MDARGKGAHDAEYGIPFDFSIMGDDAQEYYEGFMIEAGCV